ncbi:MAG TPA: hypothetical protein VFQ87_03265 [Bradyrhizobium sp.]|nr:hypothetical protein [Bradyrhizobium sp.]
MTHLERDRRFRAILTCTTCDHVVAVGPPERDPAMAAYRLGAEGPGEAQRHLGKCAGGALVVTTDEEPTPAAPLSLFPPEPSPPKRRGPYSLTPARILRRARR